MTLSGADELDPTPTRFPRFFLTTFLDVLIPTGGEPHDNPAPAERVAFCVDSRSEFFAGEDGVAVADPLLSTRTSSASAESVTGGGRLDVTDKLGAMKEKPLPPPTDASKLFFSSRTGMFGGSAWLLSLADPPFVRKLNEEGPGPESTTGCSSTACCCGEDLDMNENPLGPPPNKVGSAALAALGDDGAFPTVVFNPENMDDGDDGASSLVDALDSAA